MGKDVKGKKTNKLPVLRTPTDTLDKLTEEQKMFLYMGFLHGSSDVELGEALSFSPKTVRDIRLEKYQNGELEQLIAVAVNKRKKSIPIKIQETIEKVLARLSSQELINQISPDKLATVFGILIDKQRLIEGESTQNVQVIARVHHLIKDLPD